MKTHKFISYEQEELHQLAPTLFHIKKENAFKVPKGYFEELPAIVQEQCIATEKKPFTEFLQQFIFILNHRLVIPVAMVVVIAYFGIKHISVDEPVLLTANDISEYIETEGISTFEEDLLIENITDADNDIDIIESKEDIIDYLIDSDIDMSAIINEF